jgi:hypothetical protein
VGGVNEIVEVAVIENSIADFLITCRTTAHLSSSSGPAPFTLLIAMAILEGSHFRLPFA